MSRLRIVFFSRSVLRIRGGLHPPVPRFIAHRAVIAVMFKQDSCHTATINSGRSVESSVRGKSSPKKLPMEVPVASTEYEGGISP